MAHVAAISLLFPKPMPTPEVLHFSGRPAPSHRPGRHDAVQHVIADDAPHDGTP